MLAYVALGVIVPAAAYFGYQSVHEGRKRAKYQRALQEVRHVLDCHHHRLAVWLRSKLEVTEAGNTGTVRGALQHECCAGVEAATLAPTVDAVDMHS